MTYFPADPDAARVEFAEPDLGLVAVLADGSVEHSIARGEVEVETHRDASGVILAGSSAAEALVRAGILRRDGPPPPDVLSPDDPPVTAPDDDQAPDEGDDQAQADEATAPDNDQEG
jgi:hypothetical protein